MKILKYIIATIAMSISLTLLVYMSSYHVLLYKSKQIEEMPEQEGVTELTEPVKEHVEPVEDVIEQEEHIEPVIEPVHNEQEFTMMCDGCAREVTDLQAATLPEGMRVLLCPSCLQEFEIKTRSEGEI